MYVLGIILGIVLMVAFVIVVSNFANSKPLKRGWEQVPTTKHVTKAIRDAQDD